MPSVASGKNLTRRALRIDQSSTYPLFVFALRADEVLQIADISRVSRDEAGNLIGYQRPEVRRHVEEIIDYLNTEGALFPNPVILALSSRAKWESSRGPGAGDGLATAGKLTIPLPAKDKPKPAWIVDGQQRAVALARAQRCDFPVPITAFVADSVTLQRDQFLRINNTRPLPRGLVTELLPEVDSPLPTFGDPQGARCAVRHPQHGPEFAHARADQTRLHHPGPGTTRRYHRHCSSKYAERKPHLAVRLSIPVP